MKTNQKNMILPHGTPTGDGRSPRIMISVPPDMRRRVLELASRLGISESEAARQLIDIGIRAERAGLTLSKE